MTPDPKPTHDQIALSITGACTCSMEYTSCGKRDHACEYHNNYKDIKSALDQLAQDIRHEYSCPSCGSNTAFCEDCKKKIGQEKDAEKKSLEASLSLAIKFINGVNKYECCHDIDSVLEEPALSSEVKRIEAMDNLLIAIKNLKVRLKTDESAVILGWCEEIDQLFEALVLYNQSTGRKNDEA